MVDVLLEMGVHPAAAREIVARRMREGGGGADEQAGDALGADLRLGGERDRQTAGDAAGDESGGAAGEDHVADVRQLQDGLGNLLFQRPARRMQPDQFADEGLGFGEAVGGQKRREPLRPAVVCQRVGQPILVEQDPRAAPVARFVREQGYEQLAGRRGPGARFPGQRDEGADAVGNFGRPRGVRQAQSRMQNRETVLQGGMGDHGGTSGKGGA
jgi:hypothetical protein